MTISKQGHGNVSQKMIRYFWGIDIGSITVKVVILDSQGQLLVDHYVRSGGRAIAKLLTIIDGVPAELKESGCSAVRFTGSGGNQVARLLGAQHTNELVAQTRAAGAYYPEARTIIEIGGQDSKFLSVKWDKAAKKMELLDFALNSLCAAGTGAFLDQQAERLGISIKDEFAIEALKSTNPARIAGRCTVFAKSDMIHLQQNGTPLPDILAGLCLALARNFKGIIGKGRQFKQPVVFQGGVAFNQAVAQAFETVLRLEPGALIIPKRHWCMPALGAALLARDDSVSGKAPAFDGFAALRDGESPNSSKAKRHMPMLRLPQNGTSGAGGLSRGSGFSNRSAAEAVGIGGNDEAIEVYLGIDVGSTSSNVVLISESGAVVARRYHYTYGRPLESVGQGLREVASETGDRVRVMGVGATGSGRYLIGHLVGADIVCNEISAQARAAVHFDPAVDTIFEIGGQDSKYISLRDGTIVDFAMNKACAAGTGSFLQEQADRLDICLQQDFGRLAFSARSPARLGERCTVFMDSDLVHHQQQGTRLSDLTAGLAYSVARNYLNRVVNNREVGQRICFQGGVASNLGVVAAFTELLGRPVTVPPHHDITGAIGAALLAMQAMIKCREDDPNTKTKFTGFDLVDKDPRTSQFECRACPNICTVNKMTVRGEPTIYFGARCELFEGPKYGKNRDGQIPDLFAERNALLLSEYSEPSENGSGRRRLGFPRALAFYDMFPYWRAFFETLEVDLVLSTPTNKLILRDTAVHANAEMCLLAKLLYGHVYDLLREDVDAIFLPSVRNRENIAPGQPQNFYCPYIQTAPRLVEAQLALDQLDMPVVTFPYYLLWRQVRKKMLKNAALQLDVPVRKVFKAAQRAAAAQRAFRDKVRARGQEVLGNLPDHIPSVVVVGHPYSYSDAGACQDLPHKLRQLGALPIPMDYLPLESADISDRYDSIYWRSGQDILAAGQLIGAHPNLQALYLTNFACGPDSFLISYFRQMMGAKPFLLLEIDDHTADAGIITRCQVFLESISMRSPV